MKALVVRVLGSRGLMVPLLVSAAALCYAGPAEDIERCRTLMQTGQHVAALEILDGITAPEFLPQVLQLTADCHKRSQRWDKATASYEKLLALPNSALSPKDLRVSIMDCRFAAGEMGTGYVALDALVKDFPADAPTFHFVVGRRLQWMHQYSDAAKEFRKSLDLAKGDTPGLDEKDLARRYILCSLTASDYAGALSYLPTFVSNYPDSIPDVVSKELYRWKFKIPQVIEIIEKAIGSTGRDTTELKIGLADCYLSTNNWDKGLATLEGISTSKRHANWHVAMAKCYWGQNKKSEAVEELEQAIKMGSSLDSKKLLMEYYRDMGDFENMFAQADLLQKEWPENAGEWLMNQGWACLDMGELEKAVPLFREAISRYPDNRWVIRGSLVSLAECLYRLGKGEEALSSLSEYYGKRPELKSEYLLVYAQVLRYGPHDRDRSVAILKKLIADYPTDPMAYEARKFLPGVLQASGKYDEVVEMLQSQLNGVPSWREWEKIPLKSRIADNYFKGKDYSKAADAYREVIAARGTTKEAKSTAMYRLAVCQQETGNYTGARHTYRTVLTQDGAPDSIRAKAMCGLAQCYWRVGLKNAARRLMQEISNKYPDMEEARSARETLELWSKG